MAAPPTPAPSQQQLQAKEQLQKAVAMNALRLHNIGERIKSYFRGGPNALQPSHLNHLVLAFARGIDYALSGGDVPKIAAEIPDTMRKPADYMDILRMADGISGNLCTPVIKPDNDSTVLRIISTVMPRYYPKLKFDHLVTSLEAKVGYNILMADFFIHRNLPKNEKIATGLWCGCCTRRPGCDGGDACEHIAPDPPLRHQQGCCVRLLHAGDKDGMAVKQASTRPSSMMLLCR